jgi:uncharacterized membrane protein (DUF2068 family)
MKMGRRFQKQSSDVWIVLIGILKLIKGIGLLILGVGLLKMMHRDVAAVAAHWIEVLRLDPENHYIHSALARVFRVTPKQLRELSAGTFIYSAVFLIEGAGLILRKHWAEYLALVTTGLFIPLEVYEIYHRFTWIRVAVLIVNVAIVWYLAARIKRRKL